ncbi:rhodanese-like domain-containing protein [Chryseobacterium balustinum]|uniref:Hydroxyacylglutathione hydrolase n=1 Tax=Chryseobacterium balustinum TaxID=246 RepID=A0AAX2ISA9_9FLAO|nr:rhodanese-like domain-containing protein [Chryseobacterium balustinum]AZB28423.1 rhodanese-like domain-containing protein [Chryseobacterium balustinum]SKC04139.1 hydroxyacylglutathione hydrolase [Chryseobacterium balustinum]SQA92609.1 Probable adenylyltransferase/sulfurtransferase MoeZ [Chryseobacterium balustinum]
MSDIIDINEFETHLNRDDIQIVDVRNKSEYEEAHIQNADNVFVGTLEDHLDEISKDKTVIIHCQSGDRAAIAYSLLRKNGFKDVKNFSGGMTEWLAAKGRTVH